MSLSIAPDLWENLCDFLQRYPTGEATLYQHEGTVRKIALTTVMRSQELIRGVMAEAQPACVDTDDEIRAEIRWRDGSMHTSAEGTS